MKNKKLLHFLPSSTAVSAVDERRTTAVSAVERPELLQKLQQFLAFSPENYCKNCSPFKDYQGARGIQRIERALSALAGWAADRDAQACDLDRISDRTLRRALSAPDAPVVRHVHCHAHARAIPKFWASPHGRLIACSMSAHGESRESLASSIEGPPKPLPATVLKPFPNRSATARHWLRIPGNSGISREASRKALHRVRVLSGIPSGSRWDCSGIASVSNCDDQFSGLRPDYSDVTRASVRGCPISNRKTSGLLAVTPCHTASRRGTPCNADAWALSRGRRWDVPRDIAGTALNENAASTLLALCSHEACNAPCAGRFFPQRNSNSGSEDSPKAAVFRSPWAQQQVPDFEMPPRSATCAPCRHSLEVLP